MSLHLITGYAGQEHITAADHASFNIAMFGAGEFVLDRGNKFKAEIISNNLIRILDGDLMLQGRHVRLAENTYEELMIDNGTQGMKRNDLIVARYSKDATTGIENCEFVVLKGTENAGEAVDAAYITGDITENGNDLVTEFPLYRIRLNGLNIQSVDTLFTIGNAIQSEIDGLKSAVGHSKKNLLKYPYYSSTVSQLGVTFTVNSDGTIATSGTSTNLTSFAMSDRQTSTLKLRAGTYIVSGCPQGGSESTYRIAISITNKDGVGERVASDFGNGAIFTLKEDALIGAYIDVLSAGVNMANLTFKPMIRYASIQDDTYEPYVADVLTRLTNIKEYTVNLNSTYTDAVTQNKMVKKNGWVYGCFQFKIKSNVTKNNSYYFGSIPEELIPAIECFVDVRDTGTDVDNTVYGTLVFNQNRDIMFTPRGTISTIRWNMCTFAYPLLND